jgi:putative peptidoglycan lipid II flippase
MVGAGVMQINLLIDWQFASFLPIGSLSYLYYADRLYQLPLSIFGVAIGTALLPSLSKLWRSNLKEQAIDLQNKALTFALFMNLPAAVGLIVLSHPLIALLFGHGQFSDANIAQTAPALAAYATGLPAYVAAKVFTTTFFAQNDTKTPVKVASFSILGNFILNLCLMPFFNHIGLALATSIAAYGQVIALGFLLYKRNLFYFTTDLTHFFIKITWTSLCMGLLIYFAPRFAKFINIPTIFHQYHDVSLVLGGCAIGIFFYMSSSYYLGTMKKMRD